MRRLVEFTRRHPDAVAALALLFLPLAILGHALMPGKVMSPADLLVASFLWAGEAEAPQNGLLADITYLFHPSLIYAANEIRAGRFPTWNPHEFAGAPFFANPQTGLLFPLHALAYVLPLTTALTLISILKLSVAGLETYWFLRQLSVSIFSAFIASLTATCRTLPGTA